MSSSHYPSFYSHHYEKCDDEEEDEEEELDVITNRLIQACNDFTFFNCSFTMY